MCHAFVCRRTEPAESTALNISGTFRHRKLKFYTHLHRVNLTLWVLLYCCILVLLNHISIIALLCGHHIKRRYTGFRKGAEKKLQKILPALKMVALQWNACQIPTLHYRRIRGNMIETYKIITGKYQGRVAPSLIKEEIYVTRGNDFRLQKRRVRYDLRKFGFSNRVVNTWNSLPNWVVSPYATDTFKARLDKFWHGQDIV